MKLAEMWNTESNCNSTYAYKMSQIKILNVRQNESPFLKQEKIFHIQATSNDGGIIEIINVRERITL
jgi:hypothetical protein